MHKFMDAIQLLAASWYISALVIGMCFVFVCDKEKINYRIVFGVTFEGGTRIPTLLMLEKYANALGKHIEVSISDKE